MCPRRAAHNTTGTRLGSERRCRARVWLPALQRWGARAGPSGPRKGRTLTAQLLDGGPLLRLLPRLGELLVPSPHGLQQQADAVLQEAKREPRAPHAGTESPLPAAAHMPHKQVKNLTDHPLETPNATPFGLQNQVLNFRAEFFPDSHSVRLSRADLCAQHQAPALASRILRAGGTDRACAPGAHRPPHTLPAGSPCSPPRL